MIDCVLSNKLSSLAVDFLKPTGTGSKSCNQTPTIIFVRKQTAPPNIAGKPDRPLYYWHNISRSIVAFANIPLPFAWLPIKRVYLPCLHTYSERHRLCKRLVSAVCCSFSLRNHMLYVYRKERTIWRWLVQLLQNLKITYSAGATSQTGCLADDGEIKMAASSGLCCGILAGHG